MGLVKSCNTRILINELDLSGYSNGVSVGLEVGKLPHNVFQSCAELNLPKYLTPVIEHNGYFTGPEAGELENTFHANLGADDTDVVVTVIFGTNFLVPVAYSIIVGWADQMSFSMQGDQLITISGNWQADSGNIKRVTQLETVLVDDVHTSPTKDFLAAKDIINFIVHITEINGTVAGDGIEIVVETDTVDTFAHATVLGTLTFDAVGGYQYQIEDAERYLRYRVTDLDGATDFTIYSFAGG